MNPHLLLVGYYGCGNLGDDAILTSILHFAKREFPSVAISYLSGGDVALYERISEVRRGYRAIPRMHPAVIRGILESDLVVLGGGSLLQSRTSRRSLSYYLALLSLSRSLSRETALRSSGIGPFPSERDLPAVRRALSHLSYRSLRDEPALSAVRDLAPCTEAFLSADPAVLLWEEEYVGTLPGQFLLVSLKKGIDLSVACRTVADAAQGRSVVFVDLFPREDAPFTKTLVGTLSASLSVSVLPPPRSLSSLLSVVRRADGVLTARYHLALLSYLSGVPFDAVGDDPKLCAVRTEKRSPSQMKRDAESDLFRFFSRFA